MPEIKNTFLKSKMNKDLDARLVPNGEYRDAQNVSISRSEGSDVGALENVLGNEVLTNLKTSISQLESSKAEDLYPAPFPGDFVLDGLEIIGYFMDMSRDMIYIFMTDYKDASNDRLSNFAPADITGEYQPPGNPAPPTQPEFIAKGAGCYIVQYNINNNVSTVLLGGNFLNFSKTHPILNINLLEDLLFWTDNRNQPRKINVKKASLHSTSGNGSYESWLPNLNASNVLQNNPYYYNEDHISVAKFAPYESMTFLDNSNNSTLISNNEELLPQHIITNLAQATGSPFTAFTLEGDYTFSSVPNGSEDIYFNSSSGDKLIIPPQGQAGDDIEEEIVLNISLVSAGTNVTNIAVSPAAARSFDIGTKCYVKRKNPTYNSSYKGDTNVLKDDFAKFSYRFKYDDNEYSLMASFIQAEFVPKQFGYFVDIDEKIAAESTDVKFMENRVDQVKLNIALPTTNKKLKDEFKIKEIQILVKNSDEQAVRVIEDVPISTIENTSLSNSYLYNYLSSKAIKTSPEAKLIRVHDKVPIRALTQESAGNRIIYGNFVDKHASPDFIDYDLQYNNKVNDNFTVEFPNHTVKQNRSYQVGIVLVDRYGRASNVILNDSSSDTISNKNSTIYAPYINYGASSITFTGNFLKFYLKSEIPSNKNSIKQGYPGLYSETNPTGYYSYRIVVKQQEQDYYNIYTPGALAGELLWDTSPDWKTDGGTGTDIDFVSKVVNRIDEYLPNFTQKDRISMITLFGDNINKVPRELKTSSNANDTTFGSETILFNRVNPIYNSNIGSYNVQSTVSSSGEKVVSIEPFRDLGSWTTTKGNGFPFKAPSNSVPPQPYYPYFATEPDTNEYALNFHDIFFNASANPFIATIETDFKIGATPEYVNQIVPTSTISETQAKLMIERAWQDLGVFETRPTKSALDIYLESSSSGLVSSLSVDTFSGIPAGIVDSDGNSTLNGNNIEFIFFENLNSGSPISKVFQLQEANGNIITTNSFLIIDSVIDGDGFDRSSEFSINPVPANNWTINISTTFLFKQGSNFTDNFTFNLLATDSTGSNFSNISLQLRNCRLQNVAPVWGNLSPTTKTLNINSPATIYTITLGGNAANNRVNNGSVDLVRDNQELVFEVYNNSDDTVQGDFEVVSTGPSTVVLRGPGIEFSGSDPDAPTVSGPYNIYIEATDANGTGLSTKSNVVTIIPQ